MTKSIKTKKSKYKFKHWVIETLLYLIAYSITFLILERIFKSFVISEDNKLLWALIAVMIIYIFNKVLRPVLVTYTIPLTGITFGLFYFVINTLILKITDWLLGPKLNFTNIWVLFLITILLALLRFIIEELIMKPIIRKVSKK